MAVVLAQPDRAESGSLGLLAFSQRLVKSCLSLQWAQSDLQSSLTLRGSRKPVDGSSGHAVPISHGDDAVEPTVFLGRCLKVRRHAHVVFGRTDVFTAREPVHDLFWAVAHTEISHADQGAVIGLHHQP